MSRQLLIETKMNALSLVEGVQSKSPNCLGTISGPCADYDSETRNGNFYSRKLWENVFKDDLVKEALEDRVLFGELDHPQDRLESHISEACIVMTGYKFNDDKKVVEGTFDILPTPKGKILRSLLDYGCKIGVSSRGEGDVTEGVNGRNDVAEDGSYYFVGFDAVALPAVKKAKPALQESVHKRESLKKSLSDQIKSASTKSELDLIKNVLEAVEMPDIDSLKESIENKSKELEGISNSSTLVEDLERSMSRVTSLEEENKKLAEEVANSKSQASKFLESYSKMTDERDQIKSQFEELQKEYSSQVFSHGSLKTKLERLKHEHEISEGTIQELREELRTAGSMKSEYESRISSLEESLERSQNSVREKSLKVKELNEALKSARIELRGLQESSQKKVSRLEQSAKSVRRDLNEAVKTNQKILESYAIQKSSQSGIDSKRIVESLKPEMTTSDIDKMIDEEVSRRDRYRKMPVSDSLLEAISQSTLSIKNGGPAPRASEELSQASSFMEQYYKKN